MQSPEITAAIINSIGTLLATLMGATAAALIGKQLSSREKLKAELDLAIQDIHFLLRVEEQHCNLHKENGRDSHRQRVRDHVTNSGDVKWSGRFTPGRVNDRRFDAR